MCAHDDEVHLSRLGGVDNLLKGDAVQDDPLSREPSHCHTRQRGLHAALHGLFHSCTLRGELWLTPQRHQRFGFIP